MHWLSWERLSVHKFFGGMGFKEITYFNVAMLGSFKRTPLALLLDCLKLVIFLTMIL